MKRLHQSFRALLLFLPCLTSMGPALAAPGGPFGLGLILGNPTGLSWKYLLSQRYAISGAAAWHFDQALHVHVDHVWRFPGLIPVEVGTLTGEVGVGGRITTHKERKCERLTTFCEEKNRVYLGVRIPFIGDYNFADAPIDIFLEIAPAISLIPGTDIDLDLGMGARYFF